MKDITAVICAYNEVGRIGNVLKALENHPLVHEVIVIDDGSVDKTSDVVKTFPSVRLARHEVNKGKSYALATGVSLAKFDTLLLLDADLEGLTREDITELITPINDEIADVSLSIRANSLLVYKIIGLDFVSGERVLSKSLLLPHLEYMQKLPSYGIEVYINQLIIKEKLRVRTVKWDRVIGPRKSSKMGFTQGMTADAAMIVDILNVISIRDIVLQNYRILSLTV